MYPDGSPGLLWSRPGLLSETLRGLHPVPGLNDGWDGRRRIAVAVVALAKVFIRVFAAGMTTFTHGQYPIPSPVPRPGCDLPASVLPQTPGNQSAISRSADSVESDP
jgi:hypothetical protein